MLRWVEGRGSRFGGKRMKLVLDMVSLRFWEEGGFVGSCCRGWSLGESWVTSFVIVVVVVVFF